MIPWDTGSLQTGKYNSEVWRARRSALPGIQIPVDDDTGEWIKNVIDRCDTRQDL